MSINSFLSLLLQYHYDNTYDLSIREKKVNVINSHMLINTVENKK